MANPFLPQGLASLLLPNRVAGGDADFSVNPDLTQANPVQAADLFLRPRDESFADFEDRLMEIERERQDRVNAARQQGFLERYPVVDSPEKEKAVRADLANRGLNQKQIDKRIEKFKKKGGKVKTSAKLGLAAKILGAGAGGWLQVAQRVPNRNAPVFQQLQQEREMRAAPEIQQANQEAQLKQQAAVLKVQEEIDSRQKAIANNLRNNEWLDKSLLKAGVDINPSWTVDDKAEILAQTNKSQIDEVRERRDADLAVQYAREERLTDNAQENQAHQAFTRAFRVLDSSVISDDDLAVAGNIDMTAPDASIRLHQFRNAVDEGIEREKDYKEIRKAASLQRFETAQEVDPYRISEIQERARRRQELIPTMAGEAAIKLDSDLSILSQGQALDGATKELLPAILQTAFGETMLRATSEDNALVQEAITRVLAKPKYGLSEKEIEELVGQYSGLLQQLIETYGSADNLPPEFLKYVAEDATE